MSNPLVIRCARASERLELVDREAAALLKEYAALVDFVVGKSPEMAGSFAQLDQVIGEIKP